MVYLEKLPRMSAGPILEFIRSDAAKSCTGWISSKCMEKLFGDPKISIQLRNMNRINEELEKIKQDTPIELRTNWEHLNARIFKAEMGIHHKFELMQTILSAEDCKDRCNEVSRLGTGILDTNCGILSNLSVIHQGLVGQTMTEKGLLELWYERVYNNMIKNPMSAKTSNHYVTNYLNRAIIVQFKGFLLFAGANTNSGFGLQQLKLFEENLQYQIKEMEKTVPTYIKYLTDPDAKHVFFIRPDVDGNCKPFVQRKGKTLTYEFFGRNIEDGKWIFEKSLSFKDDGSLFISGRSTTDDDDKVYYMKVAETNTLECVTEQSDATPFFVIPLNFENKTMKIIMCTSEQNAHNFVGNRLTLFNDGDDREFNLCFEGVRP